MSYAVRNDGLGWRAVNGPEDVGVDETYSVAQPIPPQPDPVQQVIAQIDTIERETLMNRAVREFMLAQAEQIAAASGYTPAQLYQVNLGYRKVKDIDTQIAVLRAQIGLA